MKALVLVQVAPAGPFAVVLADVRSGHELEVSGVSHAVMEQAPDLPQGMMQWRGVRFDENGREYGVFRDQNAARAWLLEPRP